MSDKPAKRLYTIGQVVEAFGGTTAMAEWAGIGKAAVSNWIANDEIPAGWHYRIDREAREQGFVIDPRVFGVPPGKVSRSRNGSVHA